MKKIALISSFCNNDEKIAVLKENILVLKKIGLDVLVISPLRLPEEIIELSDFVFFTKENPVLKWPDRAFSFWKKITINQDLLTMHHTVDDYGWAALYQVKKMSQIALSYDYDLFYHLIYDLDIDDVVIDEIKNNETNLIHKRVNPNNPNDIWEATLHFMIFDRITMTKVIDMIDRQKYLSTNGVAEGQALKWAKEIPLQIKDYPVKDKIYYWKNVDFFDISRKNDYKLFFNKSNEKYDENFKIIIYDVVKPQTVGIIVNDEIQQIYLEGNQLFVFESKSLNIYKLIIEDDSGSYDLTNDWLNTSRNLIYYDKELN